MNEIEVKYQLIFLPKVKKLMDAHGFVFTGKVFERNFVFDTANNDLQFSNKTLRLRILTKDLYHLKGLLTTKTRQEGSEFKSHDETQTAVDNPTAILQVLKNAFEKHLEYQKFRSTYYSESFDIEACVDELPFGTFLELEGKTDEALKKAIKVLKLENLKPILVGYPTLCAGKNQTYEFKYVKRAFSTKKINAEFSWD